MLKRKSTSNNMCEVDFTMKKNEILKLVPLIALLIFVTGCATNYFTRFYRDLTANIPPAELSKGLMPYSGTSKIFTTNDLKRDRDDLLRRGYVAIGESSFQGAGRVTPEMLQQQAKNIGADVVLYLSQYQGAQQTAMPFIQYNPGQTSTTYSSGTVNANAYGSGGYAHGSATYSGTSNTTTSGTYSTTQVPITLQHYAHDAIFWRKIKPPILGLRGINLPDEIRTSLQRNTGVLVQIVIDDSPAFRANILPGDIITEINGNAINSQQDLSAKLPQFSGKKCDILILRDGKPITISVQMNTRPDN